MNIPEKQSYDLYNTEIREVQQGMSREEVRQLMALQSEAVFDPENLPPVKHHWVDRGLKMSCEGAAHPNHQAWKRR